ncbi:MAG: FapA family protein [Fibrobacterales bacterium]
MELFPMFEEHLSVEIRDDGTYFTLERGSQGLIKIDDFRRELLNANIMNFDLKRIKTVLESPSSGKSEFVGSPFRFFNEEKHSVLELKVSPTEVQLYLSSDVEHRSFDITTQDIEYILTKKNVRFGLDWDLIAKVVKRGEKDAWVTVACALPAEDGEHGQVKEEIEVDKEAKPLIIDGGQADFRNVGEIKQVKKNELIAVRIPPSPGKEGKDVFGEIIEPTPGKEAVMLAGVNTVLSEDGNELTAKDSGYLYRDKGAICVGLLYIVQGDVDFESGNIQYEGDVQILGSVLPDFKVVATGEVIVEGQVDSAYIESSGGSITINQGVFGKEKGEIKAKKDVNLYLIQDTTVKAGGKVTVKKSMTNCNVSARQLDATENNCQVNASTLKLEETCEIYQCGSKQETTTKIVFEDKSSESLKKKMEECDTLSQKMDELLEVREKRLRSLRLKIKTEKDENDVDLLKSGIEEYTIILRKKELLMRESGRLTSEFMSAKNVNALLTFQVLYPELQVELGGRYNVFNNSLKKVEIKIDGDKIVTVPLVEKKK